MDTRVECPLLGGSTMMTPIDLVVIMGHMRVYVSVCTMKYHCVTYTLYIAERGGGGGGGGGEGKCKPQ